MTGASYTAPAPPATATVEGVPTGRRNPFESPQPGVPRRSTSPGRVRVDFGIEGRISARAPVRLGPGRIMQDAVPAAEHCLVASGNFPGEIQCAARSPSNRTYAADEPDGIQTAQRSTRTAFWHVPLEVQNVQIRHPILDVRFGRGQRPCESQIQSQALCNPPSYPETNGRINFQRRPVVPPRKV